MNKSRSSLVLGAILFVLLLPLFFILLSAVITFVFVLFWVLVLGYLWMNSPRFQLTVKVLAVLTLATLILVAFLRNDDESEVQEAKQSLVASITTDARS